MSHIPFLISCILQLLRHFQAADARGKQQVLNYYFFILVDFFSDIFNTQIIWDLNLGSTNNQEWTRSFHQVPNCAEIWRCVREAEWIRDTSACECCFESCCNWSKHTELLCCSWRLGDLHTSTSSLSQAVNSSSKEESLTFLFLCESLSPTWVCKCCLKESILITTHQP